MLEQSNMTWEELRAKLLTPVTTITATVGEADSQKMGWRVVNCFIREHMPVLGLAYLMNESEWLRVPNFGRFCLNVLSYDLEKLGLSRLSKNNEKYSININFLKENTDFLKELRDIYKRFGLAIGSYDPKFNAPEGDFYLQSTSRKSFQRQYVSFFNSPQFSELKILLGQFFDEHKDFFMAAALGKPMVQLAKNEEETVTTTTVFNPLWLRAQIPHHLKTSLSETFMNEVLADIQLKEDLDELADAFDLAKKVSLKIIFQAHNLITGNASYGKIASAGIDYDALPALNFAWVKAQMPAHIASSLTDDAQARIVGNVYAVDIDAMAETTAPVSDTVAEILRNRIRSKLGLT